MFTFQISFSMPATIIYATQPGYFSDKFIFQVVSFFFCFFKKKKFLFGTEF